MRTGDGETYLLPLIKLEGQKAGRIIKDFPHAAIARLIDKEEGREAILCDAVADKESCEGIARVHRREDGTPKRWRGRLWE